MHTCTHRHTHTYWWRRSLTLYAFCFKWNNLNEICLFWKWAKWLFFIYIYIYVCIYERERETDKKSFYVHYMHYESGVCAAHRASRWCQICDRPVSVSISAQWLKIWGRCAQSHAEIKHNQCNMIELQRVSQLEGWVTSASRCLWSCTHSQMTQANGHPVWWCPILSVLY